MRHDHKLLTGEHPFGHVGQLTLFFVFIVVWTLDSFVLKWTTFADRFVSPYIRFPCGLFIVLVAIYLAVASIRMTFYRESREPEIVRTSLYRFVRHPMYLGTILLYLGMNTTTFSISAAGVLFVIIGFYHYIARYEEKLLLERFGKEYRVYMKRVGMWMPKFGVLFQHMWHTLVKN